MASSSIFCERVFTLQPWNQRIYSSKNAITKQIAPESWLSYDHVGGHLSLTCGTDVACFHVHSKRGQNSKWAFSAHYFQKPLLIKTSFLLASKKDQDFAEISPYKASIHLTRTKPAGQKATIFGHGNTLMNAHL